ncbi:MAG TPA: apolipoprotein N-acyltransferase, partial [Candidatus Obscuribacterales bacterium]
LTGSFDRLEPVSDAPIYNAAVLTEPDGTMKQWYYKRQRVPFGEYFPYRNFLTSIPLLGGIIDHLNPMHSDTAPGRDAALFNTRYGKLGTLICFESVYPQVARESVQAGANLLVIVTNDGWYKDAIALYQHLGHAVLRALENDRFVIRAGNTGISAFIDSHGRILAQSKPLDRVALSWRLPQDQLKQNLTLFTRFGDWPIWLSLLLILLAEILSKTKRTVNNEQ